VILYSSGGSGFVPEPFYLASYYYSTESIQKLAGFVQGKSRDTFRALLFLIHLVQHRRVLLQSTSQTGRLFVCYQQGYDLHQHQNRTFKKMLIHSFQSFPAPVNAMHICTGPGESVTRDFLIAWGVAVHCMVWLDRRRKVERRSDEDASHKDRSSAAVASRLVAAAVFSCFLEGGAKAGFFFLPVTVGAGAAADFLLLTGRHTLLDFPTERLANTLLSFICIIRNNLYYV